MPTPDRVGHRRDLARFAEATDVAQVGLRDVDRAQPKQVVELLAVHQSLTGGDRHRRLVDDQLHAQRIARLDRLLHEQRAAGASAAMYWSATLVEAQRP